jgi:transcriptional regulator with XRE-family HTH domain
MAYKGQSTVSPLKRIRLARGLTMQECATFAGVNYSVITKIDRLDPERIGTLSVAKLMRVALLLECTPAELVPFLRTRVKGSKLYGKYKMRHGKLVKRSDIAAENRARSD